MVSGDAWAGWRGSWCTPQSLKSPPVGFVIIKNISSHLAALEEKAGMASQDHDVPCILAVPATAVVPYVPSPVPSTSLAHQAQSVGMYGGLPLPGLAPMFPTDRIQGVSSVGLRDWEDYFQLHMAEWATSYFDERNEGVAKPRHLASLGMSLPLESLPLVAHLHPATRITFSGVNTYIFFIII